MAVVGSGAANGGRIIATKLKSLLHEGHEEAACIQPWAEERGGGRGSWNTWWLPSTPDDVVVVLIKWGFEIVFEPKRTSPSSYFFHTSWSSCLWSVSRQPRRGYPSHTLSVPAADSRLSSSRSLPTSLPHRSNWTWTVKQPDQHATDTARCAT